MCHTLIGAIAVPIRTRLHYFSLKREIDETYPFSPCVEMAIESGSSLPKYRHGDDISAINEVHSCAINFNRQAGKSPASSSEIEAWCAVPQAVPPLRFFPRSATPCGSIPQQYIAA